MYLSTIETFLRNTSTFILSRVLLFAQRLSSRRFVRRRLREIETRPGTSAALSLAVGGALLALDDAHDVFVHGTPEQPPRIYAHVEDESMGVTLRFCGFEKVSAKPDVWCFEESAS